MNKFDVRAFRKANGLFQEQLAKELGLTQSNLSRIETNNIGLSEKQLGVLISKYGEEAIAPFLGKKNELEVEQTDDISLIHVIDRQSQVINRQVEIQNEVSTRLIKLNERLLDILEKLSIKEC